MSTDILGIPEAVFDRASEAITDVVAGLVTEGEQAGAVTELMKHADGLEEGTRVQFLLAAVELLLRRTGTVERERLLRKATAGAATTAAAERRRRQR